MLLNDWAYRSVGINGEPGATRSDRLCNEKIFDVAENTAVLLPTEYTYIIFYFDKNNKLIRKRNLRGDRGAALLLIKGERVRLYAASTEKINIDLFKNLIIKRTASYNLSDLFVNGSGKKIKLIGDSITAGSGGSGYANTGAVIIDNGSLTRYENLYGICWANYLKYRLQRDNIKVDNWGCSKYTSIQLLSALNTLIKEDDGIVICMIGTNDRLIKGDTLEDYRDRILSIIAFCQLKHKNIVLMSCIPSSIEKEQAGLSYTLAQVCEVVSKVCAVAGIPFIDMYHGFLKQLELNNTTLENCLADGLHPNDNGYYLMYRAICSALSLPVPSVKDAKFIDMDTINQAKFGDCLYYSAPQGNMLISYFDEENNCIGEEVLPLNTFRKVFSKETKFKISFNGINERVGFIAYIEPSLIPVTAENVGERIYYEYMCEKEFAFNKLKETWNLSKLLMWDVKDDNSFVEQILEGNIILNTGQVLKVNSRMWDQHFQAVERSSKLQQFSLYWITLLLEQYRVTKSKKYLESAETQIESFIQWLDNDYSKLGLDKVPSAEHAFAIRCIVFTNALCTFPKDWRLRHEILVLLMQHCEWLRTLKVKILNNHGLIMLEGILHVVNILKEEPRTVDCYRNVLLTHIEDKLLEIYNANFDGDGCCKENTIGYHVFNIKCIEEIIDFANALNVPVNLNDIKEKIARCKLVTKQMVYQNGQVPPIGDSAALYLNEASINQTYYYKEADWVIIKDENKYISFKSGVCSEAHKHVDDNSLLLRYAGQDILVDSGMYNYDRNDPIRKYLESACGHSCLYPVSLHNVLSPEYCRKIFRTGGVKYFNKIGNSNFAQGYYLLNNGFYAERTIEDLENTLKIHDSFRSDSAEPVEIRFCLHPNAKLVTSVNNCYIFKIDRLYFSINLETGSAESISLQTGYYSEQANEVQANKVLVIRIENSICANICSTIRYSFKLEEVMDNLLVEAQVIDKQINVKCYGPEMTNYSYYLYYDNLCLQKIEDIKESNCNFDIKNDGEYFVCCAYRKTPNSAISFLKSKSFSVQKRKISIFGSCVSRDVFEYDKLNNLDLKTYIARQSVLSAVSKAVAVDENSIDLKSPFQKRMVLMDLHKNALQLLAADESEYLLIDLIDERFDLAETANSIFTLSNEFNQGAAKLFNSYSTKQKRIKNGDLYLGDLPVDNLIDEFCLRISKIYQINHIILHKAKMVDVYLAKDGKLKSFHKGHLKNNLRINAVLEHMYARIEKNLPGIHIIDEMLDAVACENHKWGLAPMHYEASYYYKVLNKILQCVK